MSESTARTFFSAALALTAASCASADRSPKELFLEDPCAPTVALRRADTAQEFATDEPGEMTQVYVGGPARLPDGCT